MKVSSHAVNMKCEGFRGESVSKGERKHLTRVETQTKYEEKKKNPEGEGPYISHAQHRSCGYTREWRLLRCCKLVLGVGVEASVESDSFRHK